MTDRELEEWAAKEVMGWHQLYFSEYWISGASKRECLILDWQPLTDLNQCFMVVDRMRKLELLLILDVNPSHYSAVFVKEDKGIIHTVAGNKDHKAAKAILKAAWAAKEGEK